MDLYKILNDAKINENTVIVSFMDKNFLQLIKWWYSKFKNYKYKIVIFCIDKKTYLELDEPKIYKYPYFLEEGYTNNKLWNERNKMLFNILQMGFDFIHTDLDCFWFHDPIPLMLDASQHYDFIFSTDFLMKKFIDSMGFTVCCGFYLMKSTINNKIFFEKFVENLNKDKIDQELFNNIIGYYGVEVENKNNDFIGFEVNIGNIWKMALLSNKFATRLEDELNEETYLYHPRTTKDEGTFSYWVRKRDKIIKKNKKI